MRAGCLPRVGPTTAGWNSVAALASAMAGVTPFPFAGRTGRAARPGRCAEVGVADGEEKVTCHSIFMSDAPFSACGTNPQ